MVISRDRAKDSKILGNFDGYQERRKTAKNSGALRCFSLFFAVFRCFSLLLITIEIAQNFTVFRMVAGYGHASPPVFAENLQALTIRCDYRARFQ